MGGSPIQQIREEELKQRGDKLEELLRKESHISFTDRMRNLGQNIWDNKGALLPLGISLAGAGLVTYLACKWYQDYQTISPLIGTNNYLGGLKQMLESASKGQLNFTPNQDFLEPVRIAAEQTLQNYDVNKTRELAELVSNSREAFQSQNIPVVLEAVENLYKKTDSFINSGKEILLGVGTSFGGLFDFFGLIFSGWYCYNAWVQEDNLNDKKVLKRRLKKEWPEIRKELSKNPNAQAIYDFLEVIKEQGTNRSRLLNIAGKLKDRIDIRYKPLLETLALSSPEYINEQRVNEAFCNFDIELKREEEEQRLNNLDETKTTEEFTGSISGLCKPAKYTDIYLFLLSKGWHGGTISNLISKTEKTGENRPYFLNKLAEGKIHEKLFSDVLSFYEGFMKLSGGKRMSIIKYLFQKGNRQIASQLTSSSFYNEELFKYLESVDEIPSIGIKGQVKTIVKLNNALKQLRTLEESEDLSRLMGIINYQRPKFDESAAEVTQFLSRHPCLSTGGVLGALSEYYFLTGGDKFRSDWIKKEKSKLRGQADLEGLLDKKGEKKFSEELERKVQLARFGAFNKEVDDLYYRPLDEVLGERVERTGLELNDELINVIAGYHRTSYGEEFKPLLRDLLKVRLTNPKAIENHLDNLPGNKVLEERVNKEVLTSWKQGYTHTYQVSIDGEVKEKLYEQAEHEHQEFNRCIGELGYKLRENKIPVVEKRDNIKEAVEAFKEVSKQDIPNEKKYLLIKAKNHLQNLKQKAGIIKDGSGTVRFYDSKDPIESMQMGVVSCSCTHIVNGSNSYASIANTLDNNKKIIYMADENGGKIGRTLAVLTDEGIVTFRKYDNSNLNTNEVWVDYFQKYSQKVGLPLIAPITYIDGGLKRILKNRGARGKIIKTKLQKAVSRYWYGDALGGRIEIGKKGHNMKFEAYVLS